MKKIVFFVTICFFSLNTKAQVIDTTWLNQRWEETSKDSAGYYRTLRIDSLKGLFFFKTFYSNDKLLTSSMYSSLSPKVKNGVFTWNYPNKKMERWYKQDSLIRTIGRNEQGKIIYDTQPNAEYIEGEPIYNNTIDQPAVFPGGRMALIQHLASNTTYPEKALAQNIQGTVMIQFVINTKGEIVNAVVLKSVHPLLDEEALRVIKEMPKWIPGQLNGKKVNVMMSNPIDFHLFH